MAIRWIQHVWDTSGSKGSMRLTELALADCANNEGVSWPSIETLAKKCNLSERQIKRNLKLLEEGGSLERFWVQGYQTPFYRILETPNRPTTTDRNGPPDAKKPEGGDKCSKGVTNGAGGGDKYDRGGDKWRTKDVADVTLSVREPSKEPSKEPLPDRPADSGVVAKTKSAQLRDIYLAYPRRVEPVAAERAIESALRRLSASGVSDPYRWLLDRTSEYRESDEVVARGLNMVKYPQGWFNAGGYDSETLGKRWKAWSRQVYERVRDERPDLVQQWREHKRNKPPWKEISDLGVMLSMDFLRWARHQIAEESAGDGEL